MAVYFSHLKRFHKDWALSLWFVTVFVKPLSEEASMNKYFAELVGTFVLVFGGVGSAVLAGTHIGFVGGAFAFGLSLLAMAYAIGPISGCHINPAVTLGILIAKKINAKDAALYMVAQIIGAIIASALLLFI